MGCPEPVDFRVSDIHFRKFQLRGLLYLDALHTATQGDFSRARAVVTAIDAHRGTEIEIGHNLGLEVSDVHAGDLELQIGREGTDELLAKRARLPREIVTGRNE